MTMEYRIKDWNGNKNLINGNTIHDWFLRMWDGWMVRAAAPDPLPPECAMWPGPQFSSNTVPFAYMYNVVANTQE